MRNVRTKVACLVVWPIMACLVVWPIMACHALSYASSWPGGLITVGLGTQRVAEALHHEVHEALLIEPVLALGTVGLGGLR